MLSPGFSETSALVAVLEKRSFTRAAEQLGLSPARVSELVRNLEERTGVRLVERTTRSVAATAAGERLFDRLRPLLDDYRAAFGALEDFRSAPTGTLRLTVPPPAADFVLAPIIARFVAQYPGISLDVSISRTFVDIVDERFDAGIRPGERIARDMLAVRISDDMPSGWPRVPPMSNGAGCPRRRSSSPTTPASASGPGPAHWFRGASFAIDGWSRCKSTVP
jgi:DNA-binding transcriptional LysR family regulator